MFDGLFQPMHLLVIALIAVIVLGPRKLPELGRGLGDGIREFKKSVSGLAETQGQVTTTQDGEKNTSSAPGGGSKTNQ